jgi:enolase
MIPIKVGAKIVRDSRKENTILVWVKTSKGKFITISPVGKSTGKFEVKPYVRSLGNEVEYINKLYVEKLEIKKFNHLVYVEKYVKLGGDSLYALEASLLKALAAENECELYEFLGGRRVRMGSVGNSVGGGKHSKGMNGKMPDIQEFQFIAKSKSFKENVKINEQAYQMVGRLLKAKRRNDEGAWETGVTNEEVLEAMRIVRAILRKKGIKIEIGLDIAANSFFKKDSYYYENPGMILSKEQQIEYVVSLIHRFELLYVEDGIEENDFKGFSEILKKTKKIGSKCMIVGDDLTTTNPVRLRRAIKNKSINAIIVKPNQIGSLLKVKEVIDLCKDKGIKTIISHRSGESLDSTIADLGVGFGVDFIKTGIYGKVRKTKLKRLVKIEKKLSKRR